MSVRVIAIVAMSENRVIGNKGEIPWRLSEDQKRFKELTSGHTVLMGRKTYESLPKRFRPLPDRKNVVATRNAVVLMGEKDIQIVGSPAQFVQDCISGKEKLPTDELWIIGGEQIYRDTLPFWDVVELTLVPGEFEGDAFFPEFENSFAVTIEKQGEECSYLTYQKS